MPNTTIKGAWLLGANSRAVALTVDAKMHDITKTLPPHIRAKTVLNRSKLVNATITRLWRRTWPKAHSW